MKLPESLTHDSHVILFDGVCNLCSAWVSFVYKRDIDERFKFASLQSQTGKEVLSCCGLATDFYETMVYIENGYAYFKSEAFFKIIRRLTFPWPYLALLGVPIPKTLRDWLYDRIALNRYRLFGKKTACMIPSGDLAARFLYGKEAA